MLMYFSSGTSGNPKMVLHDSRYALAHLMTAKHWHNVNPEGLHFTITDTGWGKAVWGKFFGQWLMEAGVFTYDFDRFHASEILGLIAEHGITTLCCPPTMYRLMTEVDVDAFDLSSLEYCTTAGEALNPICSTSGASIPALPSTRASARRRPRHRGQPHELHAAPGSMGKPVPMYVMKVLRDDGSECERRRNRRGLHQHRTAPAGIMMEYYRNPEKTAEAMHDGWYHTGDTAWRDEDGYFWYVGRNDDVIKSSGYRIGPFEIESVMLEHEGGARGRGHGRADPFAGRPSRRRWSSEGSRLPRS